MTRDELLRVLELFRERCATECDWERKCAEDRLHRTPKAGLTALELTCRWSEHEGQKKAASWCAKHVRELEVRRWLQEMRLASRVVDDLLTEIEKGD